jgi:hypothetical protein
MGEVLIVKVFGGVLRADYPLFGWDILNLLEEVSANTHQHNLIIYNLDHLDHHTHSHLINKSNQSKLELIGFMLHIHR